MLLLDTRLARLALAALSALVLGSCGSKPVILPGVDDLQDSLATEWPAALPADYVQPWEELDACGYVVPAKREYFGDKASSAINALSEFVPGVEYETTVGDSSELGEGLRLTSGVVGSGVLSGAIYRLVLGGVQPGVVSADVNLRPRSNDSASAYWLGLSNYGTGAWEWHGPFSDSHVRLSTTEPGSDYLSPLGNLFVCVLAYDGAAVDVAGIGANAREAGDTIAPAAPTGLVATPYAGALMLEWHHVDATDLAGYNVYWAKQSFSDPSSWYVQRASYLEGANWHMLATTPEWTYLCITAVDISGNESAPSVVISAYPLVNELPVVQVTTDVLSGMRGTLVTLTATGAELYDWDLDGDGLFDVTGDTTGTASQTYDAMGLWRPTVKGVSSDGTKAACAAVSLIITGNTRPVASATANPQSGVAPLSVTFIGTAEDEEDEAIDLTYAWDFDGDGAFDADTNTLTPSAHEYTTAGVYGVKFRVTDPQDAWDVDTIPVQVLPSPEPANISPTADIQADPLSGDAPLAVDFDACASNDTDGSIVEYAWDWDGNGQYDAITDTPTTSHTYTAAGSPEVKVRVEDNNGARATDTVTITVNMAGNTAPTADIGATPTSGYIPLDVGFDASASSDPDGSIVRYDWDLDGDGNYEIYDGGETLSWTYSTAGQYAAGVRVTDDAGAQHMDMVTVDVNVPGNTAPTASASATPDYGETPLQVTFDASTSSDPDGSIVRYDWDFDGDGNYELYDGSSAPAWTYNTYGTYAAKVRVTDDDGAQATDAVDIDAYSWEAAVVDAQGNTGAYTSLARVNHNPAISYFDATYYDLKYVRAGDMYGTSWNMPVTVDSAVSGGEYTSLCVVSGHPAISYYDSGSSHLKYVRASNASGSVWNTPVTVDSSPNTGKFTSMCIVNSNPAISYYDESNNDLKYVRASDASGSAWNTPVTVDSAGSVGNYTSMYVVNGNPAISYYDVTNGDLQYVRASDANGGVWGTPVTTDDSSAGWYPSLRVVNSNPAISYYSGSNGDLRYVRASDVYGGTWNTPIVVDDSADTVGLHPCLCVVAGNPAISYYDYTNGKLKYARASDASGTSWDTPLVADDENYAGEYSSMIFYEGKVFISYQNYGTADLKFTVGSFPY